MRKLLLLSLFLVSMSGYSHSGRTDSRGGHNCSAKSRAKGLCTGYHYHNGGGSSSTKKVKVQTLSTTENNIKEMQTLLKNGGYYKGTIDGIMGSGTQNAAKRYLNDKNYNDDRLNKLLKLNGLM